MENKKFKTELARSVWSENRYYEIAGQGSGEVSHPAMKILQNLAKEANSILDLGCGEGTRLNLLAKKNGVGVDFSKKAIALAKKKYSQHHFLVGDLTKLLFKKKHSI